MTTVPPPNPALPQVLAAAAASPVVVIAAAPDVIAALQTGTKIEGAIAAGPDPRIALLQTAAAPVPLRLPAPLPEGAVVTAEVIRTTPAQLTIRLLTVDGAPYLAPGARPPTEAPVLPSPGRPLPGPAPLPPGSMWWPGGAQPLTAQPQISAFVLTAPAAVPDSSLLGAAGTELSVRIVSVGGPATIGTGPPGPAPLQALAPPTPPAPAVLPPPVGAALTSAAPISGAAPVPLPATAGGPVSLPTESASTTAPAPPAASASPPLAPTPEVRTATDPSLQLPRRDTPAAPQLPPDTVKPVPALGTVTGTVVSVQGGVPVVETAGGQVQLNVRAQLPPGTTVVLEIVSQRPPSIATPPMPPMPAPPALPLSPVVAGWPTLNDSIMLLQRVDPAAAQQLAQAVPDGGPRAALAMTAFVQAMRTGDSRIWPGDGALRALEAAGPRGTHLARQIAAETAELGRQVRESAGEWRAIPMPWMNDGRIERIRLMLRETESDAAQKAGGGGGTRFLIDLDLSRLGHLQLDGMFRKDIRQLDLMIRTKAALPETMRREMTAIFTAANGAMNLVGALTFQVVKKFPDPAATSGEPEKSGLWA